MKVLVCGDRNWTDRKMIHTVLSYVYREWKKDCDAEETFTVIEGQARGADKLAGEWAEMMKKRGVIHDPVPAQWDRYGKGAGPKRNREMLNRNPDLVIAFHGCLQESRGTKHMVRIAEDAGVKVWLLDGRDENMQKVRGHEATDRVRSRQEGQERAEGKVP